MTSQRPNDRHLDRIENVLSAIRAIWSVDPDLRLTQLVVNAANFAGREVVMPELFSLGDDELLAGLEAYGASRPSIGLSDTASAIDLTDSERLVLFECLHRMCETERIAISHPAEAVVIDRIAGQLERQLTEPFESSYREKLSAARDETLQDHRRRLGEGSWVERLPLEQA